MLDDRRSFLRGVGGILGANALAGGVSKAATSDNPRAAKALQLRLAAAQAQSLRPATNLQTNGDEALYPNLIGTFTKGLPHSQWAKWIQARTKRFSRQ